MADPVSKPAGGGDGVGVSALSYEELVGELSEAKRALEEAKKEIGAKTRECRDARDSLRNLQNELVRKSMHVGSLAFAIEGQVIEKTQWFSSLSRFTEMLKMLKLQHLQLAQEASAFSNFAAQFNQVCSTARLQTDLSQRLQTQFIESDKERKQLYNELLELKGNIRVFCRCRPLNTREIASASPMILDFESANQGELTVKLNGIAKKSFKFDAVFSPQTDQADVFKDTAPLATSVLDGYNVCIFAYGQTGTGKTFTMEGTQEARGVNFRILEELFYMIKERHKLYHYTVSVSVLEVYNEQIRDLLASGTQATKRLEVRQVGEGVHHVPGLVEAHVSNMSQVWEVLQTGSNARAVGSTNANEHSSRSHCIHCVMVKGANLLNGECMRSKLWLVDLAGSERIAKTEVQGERLKETQSINRSLSALGDVISALSTKSPHIPFRNSKLTHLLQDSLGGDSKALMFVQISPTESDLGETICSLNFASRVRGVELGPAKRQIDTTEYFRFKQLAEKSKMDMKSKDMLLKNMEEMVHGLELKLKERDLKNKNLQDKVKEVEAQLMVERKLARQHVDMKIAEQQMKHREEEQPRRPPLANRPLLASLKNVKSEPQMGFRPMAEFVNYFDSTEKENNPEMPEQRRSGRASICPLGRRVPVPAVSGLRRNSMIPFPSTPAAAQIPLHFLPLAPIPVVDEKDHSDDKFSLPSHVARRRSGGGATKLTLRRSLQKKIKTKSPMKVGSEKVRVSIGRVRVSIGRLAHRGRAAPKSQTQKDKERGWNIAGKGVIC